MLLISEWGLPPEQPGMFRLVQGVIDHPCNPSARVIAVTEINIGPDNDSAIVHLPIRAEVHRCAAEGNIRTDIRDQETHHDDTGYSNISHDRLCLTSK